MRDTKTIESVRLARAACQAADDFLNRAAARRARLYQRSPAGAQRSIAHREIAEAKMLLTSAIERLEGQRLPEPKTPVNEVVVIRPTDRRL